MHRERPRPPGVIDLLQSGEGVRPRTQPGLARIRGDLVADLQLLLVLGPAGCVHHRGSHLLVLKPATGDI